MKQLINIAIALLLLSACNGQIPDSASAAKEPDTQVSEKCFFNIGLNYTTTVILNIGPGNSVSGTVKSLEDFYDDDENAETALFEGTIQDNRFKVKFLSTPPAVGKASEWTGLDWELTEEDGEEALSITFYSMDYETRQWENSSIIFNQCN